VQLYRNNIAVPGAVTTVNSSTTTDIENIDFSALIEVEEVCPCAGTGKTAIPLNFINTGVGATYSNINVTVVKEA
jgi:hypothetical protein